MAKIINIISFWQAKRKKAPSDYVKKLKGIS